MPNYGVAQAGSNRATPTVVNGAAGQPGGFNVVALQPGQSYLLFNAETLTAPQSSIAVLMAMGPDAGADRGVSFSIHFASAPTAQVDIQASNVDDDAQYVSVYSSTNRQNDGYVDYGRYLFYRAQLVSGGSNDALTVIINR